MLRQESVRVKDLLEQIGSLQRRGKFSRAGQLVEGLLQISEVNSKIEAWNLDGSSLNSGIGNLDEGTFWDNLFSRFRRDQATSQSTNPQQAPDRKDEKEDNE